MRLYASLWVKSTKDSCNGRSLSTCFAVARMRSPRIPVSSLTSSVRIRTYLLLLRTINLSFTSDVLRNQLQQAPVDLFMDELMSDSFLVSSLRVRDTCLIPLILAVLLIRLLGPGLLRIDRRYKTRRGARAAWSRVQNVPRRKVQPSPRLA